MSKKNIQCYLLPVLTLAVFLLLPEVARAETLQGTLRDNEQIKNLHNGLMNIINIPVILIIVAMAFAEMFRFKIDTYGFKKILPALLLGIITAQFSYLICKLIIDLANMTILLFLDPNFLGDASGLPAKYSATFGTNLFSPPPKWVDFTYSMFFTLLLEILFMFVGSLLILVLCFLFLIRSWMIYFLVIISGVAFMALAFPPTKTYFNKWWSEFFKWTFMPVPAVFFLWFGALFLKNPIMTSSWLPIPIMSAIVAAICLVAAIVVPFKMGGPIMAKFWQYSGAQLATKKAKEYWGTRLKSTGMRAWNNYKQVGFQMQRAGKNRVSRWIGKNWMGTGMEKAKADLSHEEARAKGLTEGVQARHYYNKGKPFQIEREYIKSRGGEIAEFEKYTLGEIVEDGRRDPNNKYYKALMGFRGGSAAAKIKMSTSDEAYENLLRDATVKFMTGSVFDGLNEADGEKALKEMGFSSRAELDKFKEFYKTIRTDTQTVEMEYNKALKDPMKHALRATVGIQNVVEFKKEVDEFDELYGEHGALFEQILGELGEESDVFRNLDAEVKKKYEKYKKVKFTLKKMAVDMKAISREEANEKTWNEGIRNKIVTKATKNYNDKIEQVEKKMLSPNGEIPLWLREVVKRDASGNLYLKPMDRFTASRNRIWLDGDTNESSREWQQTYGVYALGESMLNGLPQEGFSYEDILAVYNKSINVNSSSNAMQKATRAIRGVYNMAQTGSPTQRSTAGEFILKFLQKSQLTDEFLAIGDRIEKRIAILDDNAKRKMEMRDTDPYMQAWSQLKNARDAEQDITEDMVSAYSNALLSNYQSNMTRSGGGGATLIGEIIGEEPRIGDSHQG